MAKKKVSKFKIISLLQLSRVADIDYYNLRNQMIGRNQNKRGTGVSDAQKIEICNALNDALAPFSEFLGVDIILKRRAK